MSMFVPSEEVARDFVGRSVTLDMSFPGLEKEKPYKTFGYYHAAVGFGFVVYSEGKKHDIHSGNLTEVPDPPTAGGL